MSENNSSITTKEDKKLSKEEKKEKHRIWWDRSIFLWLIIPLAIYFHLGLESLTKFETADEKLWFSQGRIQQYWQAVKDKDWPRTRINDKPGVTVALVSGTALRWEKEPAPDVEGENRVFKNFPLDQIEEAHYKYRLPILICNAVIAFYLYFIVRKMTGNSWMGLFSSTLILLQPTLLGISQIINPDSLFWSFSAALLLTFLAFLETGSVLLVILSILLMGLTLASKYVGIIFFPFLIFALGAHAVFRMKEWEMGSKPIWKKMLWRTIAYLLIIGGGIGVFAFLMPAAIVDSRILAKSTYAFSGMRDIFRLSIGIALFLAVDALCFKSRIIIFTARYTKYPRIFLTKLLFLGAVGLFAFLVVNWFYNLNIFQLFDLPFEGGKLPEFKNLSLYQQFFAEARPLVFALTPIVLITLVFSWLISSIKTWKTEWIIFILTAFIPVFFLAVIEQNLLIHVRYSIVLYPFMSVMAGILLVEFFSWGFLKHISKISLFLLLVALSFSELVKIRPFYFNYTNDFLPKGYALVDGWGYGGYQAAQYLNALPGADQMKIVADYDGVCQFFNGQCIEYSDKLKKRLPKKWQNGEINYMVISTKGQRRYKLAINHPELQTQRPVWQLNIGDRPGNFVRILSPESAYISDLPEEPEDE